MMDKKSKMRVTVSKTLPSPSEEEELIKPWQQYPKSPWFFEVSPQQMNVGGEVKRLTVKRRNVPEAIGGFYRFDRDFIKQKLIHFFLFPLLPSVSYLEIICLFHEAAIEFWDAAPELQEFGQDPKVEILGLLDCDFFPKESNDEPK